MRFFIDPTPPAPSSPATARRSRRFLLAPRLQLKYAALDAAYVIISSSILTGFLITRSSAMFQIASDTNKFPALADFFHGTLLAGIGLIFICAVITFFVSIVLSHRIVGPDFVFQRVIKKALAGDFSETINLRKLDEFKSTGALLNQLIQRVDSPEKESRQRDEAKKI